jgi:outer membrane lipoprotein-sorting protein
MTYPMTRQIASTLAGALLVLFALVFSPRAQAVTVAELLDKIDANLTYDTRESYLTMTVTKADRVKVYKMHSYGRGQNEAAMEYLEPARDKGTKMLKNADELWMWLPSVEKIQRISGHMLRQGMMGSDMSYEDMMDAAKWRTSYSGVVAGEETVDGRACWKVQLTANSPDVSYPKRTIWVDKAAFIPVRQQLFALSGTLLKSWTMTDIRSVAGRQFPFKMTVTDEVQTGSKTEIQFDKVTFAVPLQAEVFSTRWLER